jgi:hypothetical protein
LSKGASHWRRGEAGRSSFSCELQAMLGFFCNSINISRTPFLEPAFFLLFISDKEELLDTAALLDSEAVGD